MGRDLNQGKLGVWYKVREDGKDVKPPPLPGITSGNPKLGWISLDTFSINNSIRPLDNVSTMINSSSPMPSLTTASEFVNAADLETDTPYDLYPDKSFTLPCAGDDTVDLNQYGLKKNNPIILEVKRDGNGPGREYHIDYLQELGYWFVVQDENGDKIDLKSCATAVYGDDPTTGWNPLPQDPDFDSDIWHARSGFVKEEIFKNLDSEFRSQDYEVFPSKDAVNASTEEPLYSADNYVMDFRTAGERGYDPVFIKYVGNSSGGGGDNSGGESDNEDNN